MPKAIVTRSEIMQVANQLVGQGSNPTVLKVREVLGVGSTSTINKYLRQWKQAKLIGSPNNSAQLEALQAKLQSLENNLNQQQKVNGEVLKELYQEQHATSQLAGRCRALEQEKSELQLAEQRLTQEYALLQAKYTELTTERSVAWQVMLADKQQQISGLQQELLSAHKSLKDEVLELSYKNQESVLAEKIKLIKQTDLNSQLQAQIKQLQQQQSDLILEKSKLQRQLLAFTSGHE